MDAISTTKELINNEISTTDILLACIINRLKKDAEEIPHSVKHVVRSFLKTDKDFKEVEQKSMNYVKVLCSPGRTYDEFDIDKYTKRKKFIQYLEQHPTYRLSKLHNNNVTWYQISEISKFTVDLVEECYEAGRTELVQFIIDWCVSFINQQSCIYTSDGWADMLTIQSQICDPHYNTAPIHPWSLSTDESIIKKEEFTANGEDLIHVSASSSGTSLELSDRVPFDAHSLDEREESEGDQEDNFMSDGESQGESFQKISMKKRQMVKKSHASTTDAILTVTSKDKELLLLTCSCGNESKTRFGNFLGQCDGTSCSKLTCLLCCSTIKRRGYGRHLARHRVNLNSPVTKDHIDINTELSTAICFNCDRRRCIRDSFRRQNMASCKLCDTHFCTYPDCELMGKYRRIQRHLNEKHPVATAKSARIAPLNSETSDKSIELHPLQCGCKNVNSMKKHGKFWCKCGTSSCDYFQDYICLICGRTCKDIRNGLNLHLGQHETDCTGQVMEKHVEANLKLYNKVCGKCDEKGSGKYNIVGQQFTAKCRGCNTYLCMFPGCEKYYLKADSAKFHYRKKHL